ncbi:hypothetical protein EDM68_02135 [Candidatus Uhrbacteria bacterium]|nr:MAG: hypothetical protein EDM68_02135 [Candidatus Uhrbacteria bacterium]
MILALIIAIALLVVAILIYTLIFEIAEADEVFFGIVGGFIVLFIASAFLLGWLMPDLTGTSNVSGLVSAWVNNGASAESELPLYGK